MTSESERTPLLPDPIISEALDRIHSLDSLTIGTQDICPRDWLSRSHEHWEIYSFTFIVLLTRRQNKICDLQKVPKRWSQLDVIRADIHDIDQRLTTLLSTYLAEYATNHELEDFLWTPFLCDEKSPRKVRVVDFLTSSHAPSFLLCNPTIFRSIEFTWFNGKHHEDRARSSFLSTHWDRTIPCVSHSLVLLPKLVHIILLLRLVIYPSSPDTSPSQGIPDILLLVLSLAFIFPVSVLSLPYVIITLAMGFQLPRPVYAADTSFSFVLLTFIILLIQFHLPRFPGLIFCAPPSSSLPLCVFLFRGFSHVFYPVFAFFLPVCLISSILLSISMQDFPLFFVDNTGPVFSPLKTRETFLFIGGGIVVCFLWSLILVASSTAIQSHTHGDWNRFSASIGLEAKTLFISAAVYYSKAYIFPPPLNILAKGFQLLETLFGTQRFIRNVEVTFWRVLVGPLNGFARCMYWILFNFFVWVT